jgi:glucose-6-phosphate isomerase
MTGTTNDANLSSAAWAALKAHHRTLDGRNLRELFATDPARFDTLSLRLDDLLVDASKCNLTAETVQLLAGLAAASGVEARRDGMFAGAPINTTERRPVLHVALRAAPGTRIEVDGRDVVEDIDSVNARLASFADGVRSGSISALDGRPFTDVVNLGIGGSDLGPAMACAALRPYANGPRTHFVSNVDGAHLADTLANLDPARTLFLVASKTFTTIETMTNAQSARRWIVDALGEAAVARHFAALSAAVAKVGDFGIPADRVFGFWDWVGGRYSVWSAIGLPVMIAIGPDAFDRFRAGARAMDDHFKTAPLDRNLPVLLGLISVWQRAVCGFATRAVLPYDQRLARYPAFLQQLEMESTGKRVTLEGKPASHPTGAVIWGAAGTDAQHSFFQLLHQGTDIVPAEFMIAAHGHEADMAHHHRLLIANCLAQSEALAFGRTAAEVEAIMEAQGATLAEAQRLSSHRTFPGNRPSITIAYDKLDPFTLGRLVALSEHRVFVEAAVHGINAYDQWGVELGKELASDLLPLVEGRAVTGAPPRNGSTLGLLAHLQRAR